MKYDKNAFDSAVDDYKKSINNAKGKNFFITFGINNKNAFYSLAPLSRALHELGADASCVGINKKSEGIEALKDVWKTFEELESGIKNDKTSSLKDFIDEVDKKAKGGYISHCEG